MATAMLLRLVLVAAVSTTAAEDEDPVVSSTAAEAVKPVAITCKDTPGWANGWSGCAWLHGGKDPTLCRPTPNASWPSTMGWTCDYYRQQGLCGMATEIKEIRATARGQFHNYPEKNCCGCEAQDDTTCNRQTGKTCSFSICGYSQGPSYCHNLSSCLCLPGHCADSEGICSLMVKKPVKTGSPVSTPQTEECRDTPGWSNLWSGCAYQPGGKDTAWCKVTPGGQWPSTMGWTCEYYRAKGLCQKGTMKNFSKGALHNYPEFNCCGCRTPTSTTCNRNTGGSCLLGLCDASRGPTVCDPVTHKCMCQEGHCGSTNGVCTLNVEVHETAAELQKEAAGEATAAGVSAATAATHIGKSVRERVIAGATAAGDAAIRAGLPLQVAATSAADAAGAAAPHAYASPQDAADAVAAWVKSQAQKSRVTHREQTEIVAKAAARAAEKAARGSWLRQDQIEYATQAAAMKAAIECGLPSEEAARLAATVLHRNASTVGATSVKQITDDDAPSSSDGHSNRMKWAAALIVVILAVVGCGVLAYKNGSTRRNSGRYGGGSGHEDELRGFTDGDSSD
eukprot:TRINITY_DN29987_c0_g1_i1.p1 TRINITY_DN29987_c0_g1~~TRINITY_DN29987_c0_g1_i1.p1  ORF type:complete len:566 (+),score=85.18 TRINITY_DN29987_c0_g1_i1:143-1840(+)